MPLNDKEDLKPKPTNTVQKWIKAIDSMKDMVDVGIAAFGLMGPHGAIIMGVAFTVKSLLSALGPDPNEPTFQALRDLKAKMDKMVENMAQHFKDFEAFLVENHFYNGVPLDTMVLYQYMQDVRTHLNHKTLDEFRRVYMKASPLKLARKLMHQLTREITNPLHSAMKADPLMTTITFNKWKGIIETTFCLLWEIEIYAGVLIHGLKAVKNPNEMYEVKLIEEEIAHFHRALKKWEKDSEVGGHYWPEKVRKFVEKMQETDDEDWFHIRLQRIVDGLDKIHTKDIFHVIFIPNNTDHYLIHETHPDRVIVSKDHGNCTVIVVRSREYQDGPESKLDRMIHDAKQFREKFANFYKDPKQIAALASKCADNGVIVTTFNVMVFRKSTKKLKNGAAWSDKSGFQETPRFTALVVYK